MTQMLKFPWMRSGLSNRRYESQLMAMANVVGVGIGFRTYQGVRTNEPALVVMVSRKIPPELLSPEERIPAEIDGVPVDVQEVGQIYSQ